VKAPGQLVVSAYVTCPDITQVVTPDLKAPGASSLLHVDLAAGRRRLGGSVLAQAYAQVGGWWVLRLDRRWVGGTAERAGWQAVGCYGLIDG
jgi:phosphoribosylformylglycinamidine (FGAM) synthase-like enzyme